MVTFESGGCHFRRHFRFVTTKQVRFVLEKYQTLMSRASSRVMVELGKINLGTDGATEFFSNE